MIKTVRKSIRKAFSAKEAPVSVSEPQPTVKMSCTVACVCRESEPFPDMLLDSLIAQRLDFPADMHCVVIDISRNDGIRRLVAEKQVPGCVSIGYVSADGLSVAEARNRALSMASTEWVLFAGPGDYFDPGFFQQIAETMRKQKNLCMACGYVTYKKTKGCTGESAQPEFMAESLSDSHSLKYRFAGKGKTIVCNDGQNEQYFAMSLDAALFQTGIVNASGLKFRDLGGGAEEELSFALDYLHASRGKDMAFVKDAKLITAYDDAWQADVQKLPWLAETFLPQTLHAYGSQMALFASLCMIFPYVKAIADSDPSSETDDLSKERTLKALDSFFALVPAKKILDCRCEGFWYYYKVGICGLFKHIFFPLEREDSNGDFISQPQIIYIDEYNQSRQEILLRYYTPVECIEEFYLDDKEVQPSFQRTERRVFLGQTFLYMREIWLPIGKSPKKMFSCSINGVPAKVALGGRGGKRYTSVSVGNISSFFVTNGITKLTVCNPQTDFFNPQDFKETNPIISPVQMHGYSQYTIISPCYNVSRYIDEFFRSVTNQFLDFKNNIFVVAVDDGSQDDTAEKISAWQKMYPENITYVHKENGGLSSARNAGLPYVKTPWVTFIDPDDFINSMYFYNIDKFLKQHENVDFSLIGTNIIYYDEGKPTDNFRDSHPLRYKFKNNEQIVKNPLYNNKYIQLQAASTLFKTKFITDNQLTFSLEVKPVWEDVHFIYRYLTKSNDMPIAFLNKSRYLYRKRSDESSLMDLGWQKKTRFDDMLRFGLLDLLDNYTEGNYLYNIVLYELMWHLKQFIKAPERLSFLTEQEKQTYLSLLDQIFSRIPEWAILPFNLAGCWYYHKVGILHCFKNTVPSEANILYIDGYDPAKNEVRLKYYYGREFSEEFYFDNSIVKPTHEKIIRDDFCGRTFVYQKIIWLPLSDNENSVFFCKLNGLYARLSVKNKHYQTLTVQGIKSFFALPSNILMQSHWIVMDRNNQADDNAEHLYRWMMKNHPEQEAYFVLNRDSYDWPRLEKEGFNLLSYGSPEHEEKLRTCSRIISSQVDHYVVNYFNDNTTAHIPYVFLQHGVTKDDLSRWLNGKKRIDLLVTAAKDEFESIAGDYNRYKYTDKEVKLVGFPRHDALRDASMTKKEILVMPTWRRYLAGEVISGNIRASNPEFMESPYAKAWSGLLRSARLHDLALQYGYKIIFYPHPNVQQYLDEFNVPEYVIMKHQYEGSIQNIFKETAIMITDYSSVAFEMAYLYKPIIYYQFDEDVFFQGEHVYQKGYFDYRRDGFGPVVVNEEDVLDALEDILRNGGRPHQEHFERMDSYFAFRDGKCCERVYDAICDLDRPLQKIEQKL